MPIGQLLPHLSKSAPSGPMRFRSASGGGSSDIAKLTGWYVASALLVVGLYPSVAASQVSRSGDGRAVAKHFSAPCHRIGPQQAELTKHFDEDGKQLFVETPSSLPTIVHKFKHGLRGAILAQPHWPMREPMLRSADLDRSIDYLSSIAGVELR